MPKVIGFVGVGLMGRGMARNLIRGGYDVRVYNRTRGKAEEVTQIGGRVVDTPAEAARDADVIVTMLADPAAVIAVMEGSEGILQAIRPGSIVIDSSTISPPKTLQVHAWLKERGAGMIDAPVFGSKNEAERGELGFIVGADPKTFERVEDILACMGKTFYIGGNGMGSYAKLVVNMIIAINLEAMNEGMVLARKAGIDPDVMMQVIQTSRARSSIAEMKGPQVLKRDFSPFFPLRLMDKDLGLVMETGRSLNVPLFAAGLLKQLYTTCLAEGLAEEDFCSTIKYLENICGVKVASLKP